MAKINENVFKELINKKSNRDYNEYTNRELSISFATSMMALSEASGVFTDIDIVNLDKEDKDIYLKVANKYDKVAYLLQLCFNDRMLENPDIQFSFDRCMKYLERTSAAKNPALQDVLQNMIFTYHNTDIRKGDRVRTLHELAAQATKEYEKENTEESEEVNTNDFGLITLEDGRKLLVRPDKMASFNKEEYTCVNLVDGRNAYLDRNGEVVAIEEEMEIEEEEERE